MFGEKVEGFEVRVLNEREVRAGAGILFFVTTVVFLGAWHADQMLPAQMMIIAFFTDFVFRVSNPRLSPSLILGRLAVGNQKPEYTAAAPKRFAWMIGLALASVMVVTIIFMRDMSVFNFAICGVCIVLLFLEAAFGICLGCLFYTRVLKRELTLCAGGVCEVRKKEPIQQVSGYQLAVLAVFAIAMVGVLEIMTEQNAAHVHSGPNHQLLQDLQSGGAMAPPQTPMAGQHDNHAQHKH